MAAPALSDTITNRQKAQQFRQGIYGEQPMEYADVFRQAYKDLGQVNAPESVIAGGTQALADQYIESYYAKTGELPSSEQVRTFTAKNLTPQFAERFIQGFPGEQIKAQIVDPQIASDVEEKQLLSTKTTPIDEGLGQKLGNIYGTLESKAVENVNKAVDAAKQRVISEQVALGRKINDPALMAEVNKIEAQRPAALSDAISKLYAGRASGEFDVAKTGATLGQRERESARGYLLGKGELGLGKQSLSERMRQFDIGRRQRREEMGLAEKLGKYQAEANKPGWFDYLKGSVDIATGLVKGIKGGKEAYDLF